MLKSANSMGEDILGHPIVAEHYKPAVYTGTLSIHGTTQSIEIEVIKLLKKPISMYFTIAKEHGWNLLFKATLIWIVVWWIF